MSSQLAALTVFVAPRASLCSLERPEIAVQEVTSIPNRENSITHTFSLVDGSPLSKFLQRITFVGPRKGAKSIAFLFALTWPPLIILSAINGTALGHTVQIPALKDFSVYGRFIVALPLLVFADNVIDRFVRHAVLIFDSSGIVKPHDVSIYRSALEKIMRLRDSGLVELLLAFVAFVPFFLFVADNEWTTSQVSTWHGSTALRVSSAGWWFVLVSSPVLRFLMLRWLWRYALWVYLLRKLSMLDLVLLPPHPDRLGGLGFLLFAQRQFGLLAAALGAVVAGHFANEIIYLGQPLREIKAPAGVFIFASVFIVLLPLTLFTFRLFEARYDVMVRHNQVARIVTSTFDAKWAQSIGELTARMIGSQDPSSHIDYLSSYDAYKQTRVFPVNKAAVLYIAALAGAPFAFVWLLTTPLERLVTEILKRLF